MFQECSSIGRIVCELLDKNTLLGNLKPARYWQDLALETGFETGSITLTAADIIDYATDFDPQPYHLDPEVAASSIFGGHCASGWHVCALMMRLMVDTLQRENVVSAGTTSVESLRWFIPVFAGDTLKAKMTVKGNSESEEHLDYAITRFDVDVCNQTDKSVIKLQTSILVKKNKDLENT